MLYWLSETLLVSIHNEITLSIICRFILLDICLIYFPVLLFLKASIKFSLINGNFTHMLVQSASPQRMRELRPFLLNKWCSFVFWFSSLFLITIPVINIQHPRVWQRKSLCSAPLINNTMIFIRNACFIFQAVFFPSFFFKFYTAGKIKSQKKKVSLLCTVASLKKKNFRALIKGNLTVISVERDNITHLLHPPMSEDYELWVHLMRFIDFIVWNKGAPSSCAVCFLVSVFSH